MKKIGNSGFAITGILYTLFIMFILITFSILAELRYKNQMLQKSTEKLEESYKGIDVTNDNTKGVIACQNQRKALVKGKYIFNFNSDGTSITCVTYLNKGTIFSKETITFTQEICNRYSYEFNFQNESAGLKMTLTKVYSFEEIS